jgi:hypothetical protein
VKRKLNKVINNLFFTVLFVTLVFVGFSLIFDKPFNLNNSGCTESCMKRFANREQVIRNRATQIEAENKALKIKIRQLEKLQQNETKCISRNINDC